MYVPIATIKNKEVENLLDYMWDNRNEKKFSFNVFKHTKEYTECAALFKPEYVGILDEACKDMLGASRDFSHDYIV